MYNLLNACQIKLNSVPQKATLARVLKEVWFPNLILYHDSFSELSAKIENHKFPIRYEHD